MDAASAYEARAHEFLRGRDRSPIGAGIVEQWARTFGAGAGIIELGCGGGRPVTATLHGQGLDLHAIDASPTLVAEFRSRFPGIPVRCERVQESGFFDRTFEGAIAVGLIFLLSEADQTALVARVSRILLPGGRFLFSAPLEVGTWTDMNTGLECRSPGQARYEEMLRESGSRVVATRSDEGGNNYYEAEKVG